MEEDPDQIQPDRKLKNKQVFFRYELTGINAVYLTNISEELLFLA